MNEDIKEIIKLIEKSPLDQTIKDILVRDLQSEGLTEFLREQILAYCIDTKIQVQEEYQKARQILLSKNSQNPA